MKQHIPFCLVSAESPDAPDGENYAVLRSGLRSAGLDLAPVYGMWRGVPEHSFMVLLPGGDSGPEFRTVMELAVRSDQEAVLYVGADREAALIARDGTAEPVGHWQELPPVGDRPDSYTVGPDGRVYAAL